MKTSILGLPRIGEKRELKFAIEKFWKGELNENELHNTASTIRTENLNYLNNTGIDFIPCNDFSYYDRMLDMCITLGLIPKRFNELVDRISPLELYFAMARGTSIDGKNYPAMEMTKWFNTNYHYIVPELEANSDFTLNPATLIEYISEAQEGDIDSVSTLIGPVSFVMLAKRAKGFDFAQELDRFADEYIKLIKILAATGIDKINLEEPVAVLNESVQYQEEFKFVYEKIAANTNVDIFVQTYFDTVGENYKMLIDLPVQGIGLDFVHGSANIDLLAQYGFPADKLLFAGILDGRNIWSADIAKIDSDIEFIKSKIDSGKLVLAPSCSLLHCPVTLESEQKLDAEAKQYMAFAKEKVYELSILNDKEKTRSLKKARETFVNDPARKNSRIQAAVSTLGELKAPRTTAFSDRIKLQNEHLKLPKLPTTTIGSFPQTAEVRSLRRRFKKGDISSEEYQSAINEKTAEVIRLQEEIGLDVLVHGEFERNDMVEFFGEKLNGVVFTDFGWVQSYGSRCVKPPVIYADIERSEAMTVKDIVYAQGLTAKPVKGMLTGPVTILNWSFVRDDISRREVCEQLALAIREEVIDLEKSKINIIQVDEAALREGLPLRDENKKAYMQWAVDCFLITCGGVKDDTQIHTHMCYSNFNDIIEDIIRMDADVTTIENSRSDNKLLKVFNDHQYPNQIGPGVYDIHSPNIPTVEELQGQIGSMLEVIDYEQLWVNPDCGLKTRNNAEVIPSLKNMVAAAEIMRQS
jgi:5-methyltetrahydropteroyltriglutamate--homocysteine methyltransferase